MMSAKIKCLSLMLFALITLPILFNVSHAETETDLNASEFMDNLGDELNNSDFTINFSSLSDTLLSIVSFPKRFIFKPVLKSLIPDCPDWLIDLFYLALSTALVLWLVTTFSNFVQTYLIKALIFLIIGLFIVILAFKL